MNELTVYNACDLKTALDDSDLLGTGNFASVRICHFPKLQRYVAVKCFAVTGDKKKTSNAEKEAKILSRIKHENILEFLGITKWKHYIGIITELLLCGSLENLLLDYGSDISWELRARFFIELANALKYLHCHNPARSYIHGDIKPQNILLNNKLTIKLADFGAMFISRATGANFSVVTNVENTQHTPLYTAPEYLQNPSIPKTTAMDIYSFGMNSYEILTRKQVFSGSALGQARIIGMIKRDGIKPNLHFVDEVENECLPRDHEMFLVLKQVMMQCWVTKPENRPYISDVWETLNRLAKSYNIYNEQASENAEKLALKLIETVNEETDRVALDKWDNTSFLHSETSVHKHSGLSKSLPCDDVQVNQSISEVAPQHNKNEIEMKPIPVRQVLELSRPQRTENDIKIEETGHQINKLSEPASNNSSNEFISSTQHNENEIEQILAHHTLAPSRPQLTENDIRTKGTTVHLINKLSRRTSTNNSNQSLSSLYFSKIYRKRKRAFVSGLVLTFSLCLFVVLLNSLLQENYFEIKPSNNTIYSVNHGEKLEILCESSSLLIGYAVLWHKDEDLDIPVVSKETQLTEYQKRANVVQAILYLTNIQKSANYTCSDNSDAKNEITVEVRVSPQNKTNTGNLRCWQGERVTGVSYHDFYALTFASCSVNPHNLFNITSFNCHRFDYCYQGDNGIIGHVVEASCVPAGQCSSMTCDKVSKSGITSCQTSCCSTNYCNYALDASDGFSCNTSFTYVLISAILCLIAAFFAFGFWCYFGRQIVFLCRMSKTCTRTKFPNNYL